MEKELKPCPFCGKTPTINRLDPEEKIAGIACGEGPCDKTGLCICFVVEKEGEAIAQWNTRAMPECVRRLLDLSRDAAFRMAGEGHQEMAGELTAAANAVAEYHGGGEIKSSMDNSSEEVRRLESELRQSRGALSGELPGPTRTHIRRIEAERDAALAAVERLQVVVAGQQEVINRRRRPLWEHFWEELLASMVRVRAVNGGGK